MSKRIRRSLAQLCRMYLRDVGSVKALSLGRVALLGFAGRTSHVKFTVKPRKSKLFKPLQTNIQTVGDAICAARQAKNLTPGQVAAKMGIAASVICSWEDGSIKPNDWQLEHLARILGFSPRGASCERNFHCGTSSIG